MSATVIREFLVSLGFRVDSAGLAAFKSSLSSTAKASLAFGASVSAAAGAALAVVKSVANEYDKLDKLAQQFRSTTESVNNFIDSAQILGISNETAIQSLSDFNRAIIDTSLGLGRQMKVFEELGISVKDSQGNIKSTTQVMAELQEKMSGFDRGKKMRVMERLGLDPALLKLFNADMVALQKDLDAIDVAAGFDLTEAVRQSKSFMSTWRLMSQEVAKGRMLFSKMVDTIAVRLMPSVGLSIERLTKSLRVFRQSAMESLPSVMNNLEPILKFILRTAESFVILGSRFISVGADMIKFIFKLNDATGGWAGYILMAAAAWKFLNLAFLKSPLGLLIAFGIAIALLVDDMMTFYEGGEALIDWGSDFGETMKAVLALVAATVAAFVVSNAVMAAWGATMIIVNGAMKAARIAMLLFNLAMYANPAVLIIGAIVIAIGLLAGAAYLIYEKWDKIFSWFTEKFQIIKDFFSFGDGKSLKLDASRMDGLSSGRPGSFALMPPPGSAAKAGQTLTQQTTINVTGSSSPDETARLILGQQKNVNADLARNMLGAAR